MRRMKSFALLLAVLASAERGMAQTETDKARARVHFRNGLALAQRGELQGAAEAFANAYQASPHYAVLYNLGQAYATLGRSPDAVRVLEQFLRDGGERVDPARRKEVEDLVARERSRIGHVELDVSPAGTELFIDGQRVGTAPVPPLELTRGVHVLVARKADHATHTELLNVSSGERVRVPLRLRSEQELELESARRLGQLLVNCDTPGVELWFEEVMIARTPVARPLFLPIGSHTVHFKRAGYRTVEKTASIAPHRSVRLDCGVTPDRSGGAGGGSLKVHASEPFAVIRVDGSVYRGGWLPAGPHSVRIEQDGFVPWSRIVTIEPGRRREVSAILEATPDRLRERRARERRRTWAVGVGAGGVALAGLSVLTYVLNGARYRDWTRERDRIDAALAGGDASADIQHRNRALRNEAAAIQRSDDVALGMATAGAAAIITAGVLWLTSADNER